MCRCSLELGYTPFKVVDKIASSQPEMKVQAPFSNDSLSKTQVPSHLTKVPAPQTNELKTNPATLSIGSQQATIPLIDLEAIAAAKGTERQVLIKRFGDGLKEVGFIAVKAESLTPLIEMVNREMALYFHQPLEKKLEDWHNNNAQTGFSPQGKETAAGAKKADIKETYFIPPNFKQWPKNRPDFQKVMQEYHNQLTEIAAQVMGLLAEYLNEPTEDVSKSMSAAHNLLRLAYYPAPKPTDDPDAVWASAHEDLNSITLLPPSTVPGLQLLTKNNEWMPVTVPQGYLIVNTGEQLQSKTAGLIKATKHRVLNPGREYSLRERFASIFFASWSSNFSLKPFESCAKKVTEKMSKSERKAYLKKYPDVSVHDNLISRLIEMGTIPSPSEEQIKDLRAKGLLQRPPQKLIEKYPDFF